MDGKKIKELVMAGRYEEALSVKLGTIEGIDDKIFDLLFEHGNSPDVSNSINSAAMKLKNEGAMERRQRLGAVGMKLLNGKEFAAAIPYLEAAVNGSPIPQDELNLGFGYLRAGRPREALPRLSSALKHESELQGVPAGTLDMLLAEIYFDRKNLQDAERHVRAAARKGNQDAKELRAKFDEAKRNAEAHLDQPLGAAESEKLIQMLISGAQSGLGIEQIVRMLQSQGYSLNQIYSAMQNHAEAITSGIPMRNSSIPKRTPTKRKPVPLWRRIARWIIPGFY